MRKWMIAVAAVVVLALLGAGARAYHTSEVARWQAQRDIALQTIDSLNREIVRRDAFLSQSIPVTTQKIQRVRAKVAALPSPITPCDSAAAVPRDSIIAEQDSIIQRTVAERDTAQANSQDAQAATDITVPLIEEAPVGESFWSKITPEIGIGGTIGIDPVTMKPAKAIGLTLQWKVRLF